ncbi:hypothetical protein D9M68_698100 [compost metagenome]
MVQADDAEHMAQVGGEEVHLLGLGPQVVPAGTQHHEGGPVLQQPVAPALVDLEAAVDAHHVVQPELQRRRHHVVVHGGGDQQVMAGLQLADQLFGQGEMLLGAIRLAHHRFGIARAQRRQRLAYQVADDHLGLGMDAPGHFPSQLAAGRGLVVGTAFDQKDAWHGGSSRQTEKDWRK